ncbi:hypothetical protein AAP_05560 [Ascosphaera apis ARSEF 7405]|uniref:Uncharacterized protein n=1 Tax=Ascosphaera apis ARSEF 7405 TaxID=392613 RepID=A0A167VK99_9EURO|nr:hypothetical protein AAP_05560 [Ascosphaera apis ARSEF 7405]
MDFDSSADEITYDKEEVRAFTAVCMSIDLALRKAVGKPPARRAILEPLSDEKHQQIVEALALAKVTVREASQIFQRYWSLEELSPYLTVYEDMMQALIINCTIHGLYPGVNPLSLAEIRSWAPSMPEFVFKDVVQKAHSSLLSAHIPECRRSRSQWYYPRNDYLKRFK